MQNIKNVAWKFGTPEIDGTYYILGGNIDGAQARSFRNGTWQLKENENPVAYGELESDTWRSVSLDVQKASSLIKAPAAAIKRAKLNTVGTIISLLGERKTRSESEVIARALVSADNSSATYDWMIPEAITDEAVMSRFDDLVTFVDEKISAAFAVSEKKGSSKKTAVEPEPVKEPDPVPEPPVEIPVTEEPAQEMFVDPMPEEMIPEEIPEDVHTVEQPTLGWAEEEAIDTDDLPF